MDVQIVHEQRNRSFPYLLAELLEVIAEVFACARLIMNLDQPDTVFLCHGCYDRPVADVDLCLIDRQIRILRRPLPEFERSLRKVDLVDVYYETALQLCLLYLIDQISAVLDKVLPQRIGHDFLLPYLLTLYPMSQIKPPQGSHSYSLISELPMEVNSSFLHGESSPPF